MKRRRSPAPRWETPLPAGAVGSWGPHVIAYLRRELGLEPDLWQRRVIMRALVVDRSGRLLHREYLASTARQQGKTVIVRGVVGWGLTTPAGPEWSLIYGLAHLRAQARIPYDAILADLRPIARRLGPESRGGLALTRYLGLRSNVAGWPREYHLASRDARDALRGYSIDLAVFDEIRTQRDDATYAALKPTISARPEPLILEISSAGDERSVLLRRLWERGIRIIEGIEPAEGFGMSWWAAGDDDAADDPAAWRKASPAYAEGRIAEAVIRDEYRSLTPSSFRQERLNLFSDAADEWLPPGIWARQAAPAPAERERGMRVALGVDVAPDWSRATIAVAIARDDEAPAFVGIAADLAPGGLQGTVAPDDLIAALSTLVPQWGAVAVAWVRSSAAHGNLEAWAEDTGLSGRALTGVELRGASELFRAELVGGRLTHAADPLLGIQARAARPSGPLEAGAWYFSIRHSRGPIDAIRASAWAAFVAIGPVEPPPVPAVY